MCASAAERPGIRLRAPAKINLCLAVTGRREDGYHDVFSLMAAVDLCDTLRVVPGGTGVTVHCSAPGVPEDETNLAARAARAFFAAAGRPPAAGIHIDKRIPVGAGLGGGSSDAAAVLRGLNRHFRNPIDPATLHRLAAGLGADVPFFLSARPALATGIGDRLTPFDGLAPASVVIVYPGVCVPTAEVYRRLKMRLTTCQKKSKVSALKARSFDPARHLCNDLEPVAGRLYPVIPEAKSALLELGAAGALMTGSGSAVFGLFADARQAARARDAIERRSGWRSFRARLLI